MTVKMADDNFIPIITTAINRKKRLTRLIQVLGGGDSPLEAFELALGRDYRLFRKVINNVYTMCEMMDEFAFGKRVADLHKIDMLKLMWDCNIWGFLQRLLSLPVLQAKDTSAEKDREEEKNPWLPWKSVYFSSLNVLSHLTATLCSHNNDMIKTIVDTDIIELVMNKFLTGDFCVLASCAALPLIRFLTEQSQEARERFSFQSGIEKLTRFLHKDDWTKEVVAWYHRGLEEWEERAVLSRPGGLCLVTFMPFFPKQDPKANVEEKMRMRYIVSWGRVTQERAADICYHLGQTNDRFRLLIMKNGKLLRSVLRWYRTPAIVPDDVDLLWKVAKAMSALATTEEIALKLINDYKLLRHLEVLVYCPSGEILQNVLQCVLSIVMHRGKGRTKIAENEAILKAVISYCGSFEKKLVVPSLAIMQHLTEGQTGLNILKAGFGLKEIVLINDYHDSSLYGTTLRDIKRNMKTATGSHWKKSEAELSKLNYDFDINKATELKNKGNACFREKDYETAQNYYSQAIDFCPPSQKRPVCTKLHPDHLDKGCSSGQVGSPGPALDKIWYKLPAALYSNRAQCFLHLGEYESALEDCNQAIARCMEELEEAKTLRLKSVFRRARALYELEYYQQGLHDVGYCIIKNKEDEMFRDLFDKMFYKYRMKYGYDIVKRCCVCLEGDGDKLKRCEKCDEVYCSKDCQMKAWKNGHKAVCGTRNKLT
ncbi:uncharacterized protein LOC106169247 [Lingula anatina]|uniref:Uncharacterized protein LOC106169247 n=1 Tax=Lingula anatina TaxID=7574 RepID=A0A1S3J0Y9_LINAN|nr:uncharacterized protein LOC106169247 [Lingula anatina]|eukprot:XP_013404107.1 uncharacterized protein LOC106169247 [Lingula anatina]